MVFFAGFFVQIFWSGALHYFCLSVVQNFRWFGAEPSELSRLRDRDFITESKLRAPYIMQTVSDPPT